MQVADGTVLRSTVAGEEAHVGAVCEPAIVSAGTWKFRVGGWVGMILHDH
jgi:hypothetical protein